MDGRLQVGDEITHINGQSVIDATHHEVIGLMSQAGTLGSVSLRIQRKMPPTGIEFVFTYVCTHACSDTQRHAHVHT